MQFSEIRKDLEGIVFDTLRVDQDNYFEAVIVMAELEKLEEKLKKFFGEAVSSFQDARMSGIQEAVKEFGGIRSDQTLYFWNKGPDTIFAMLWSWQDGWHTTVKIIQK